MKKLLSHPALAHGLVALISFTALAAAFIAEGFLHLEPCQLCIYQRYPFALGLLLGLIGLALHKNRTAASALLGVSGLGFLANTGIAFYHTGVEQKWWKSEVNGCSVPLFQESTEGQSLLENIMSTPMGDCSKIPWQDPILGLSMANYNIPLCFGLFVFCVAAAVLVKKRQEPAE